MRIRLKYPDLETFIQKYAVNISRGGIFIATKQPKSYDLVMQHLLDLRNLAKRLGNESDFSKQIAALREAHSRKPSLLARLLEKGM